MDMDTDTDAHRELPATIRVDGEPASTGAKRRGKGRGREERTPSSAPGGDEATEHARALLPGESRFPRQPRAPKRSEPKRSEVTRVYGCYS